MKKLGWFSAFFIAGFVGTLWVLSLDFDPVNAQTPAGTQCVSTAVAGGTGDAITIPLLPCTETTTQLILTITAANTIAAPTISVNGQTPHAIKGYDGTSLTGGFLQPSQRRILTFNGTNWFVLNENILPAGAGLIGVVTPEQYKQPSDPDDTLSIQAALDSCFPVALGAKIYIVSKRLNMCATGNQTVLGVGPQSVVKVTATFDSQTTCVDPINVPWNGVFANRNCGGATGTYVDKNLTFRDFKIDATANPPNAVALIGIFARKAQYVTASHITCESLADCTAFLGSDQTLVESSVALNSKNSGFDFWDSPSNATVVNNTTYCVGGATGGDQFGFTWNSSNTTADGDGTARNYYSADNKAYGCKIGLMIAPLTHGGLIDNFYVSGFLSDGLNASTAAFGILVQGNSRGGYFAAPVVRNYSAATFPVVLNGKDVTDPYTPTNINISGLQFQNITIAPSGANAALTIASNGSDRITGTTYLNVTQKYAVEINASGGASGDYFDGNYPLGTTGLVLTGVFPDFHNSNFINTTVTACGTLPAVAGVSTATKVTVGIGGPITACTIVFPASAWAYRPTCTVTPEMAGDQMSVTTTGVSPFNVTVHSAADMASHSFGLSCKQI